MFGPAGAFGAVGSGPRSAGTKWHRTRFPSGIHSTDPKTVESRPVNMTGDSGLSSETHQSCVPDSAPWVKTNDNESCDQLTDEIRAGPGTGMRVNVADSCLRNDRPRKKSV